MDKRAAQNATDNLLAKVRLGIYRSPAEQAREREEREAKRVEDPLFGPFAEEWFERRCILGGRAGKGLSRSGRADLRNILDQHLLPWFEELRLGEIDVREVEAYAAAKLRRVGGESERRDGQIGPTYLNKTLGTLGAILCRAVDYELIARNTAERVRVEAPRFDGSHLDSAAKITALLDAAGELDRERAKRTVPYRRALLATLTFAGLRIDEALGMCWSQVDLKAEKLHVHGTKTAAAQRTIAMLPVLREELTTLNMRRDPQPHELVFGTSNGGKDSPSNVRRRLLAAAVERANERLIAQGAGELPERLTPHSLRRTYASLLAALGVDQRVVMSQMGHRDPNMTTRVYTREMAWDEGDREALRALVKGAATIDPDTVPTPVPDTVPILRLAA